MTELEKLGNIRLYEDDGSYGNGMIMEVNNGTVFVYEHNIVEKEPDCLRRILKVELKPLLVVLHVAEELFIAEMKERYGCGDGTVILREFLHENGIKYRFQEFYNMFVFWENLSIRHHAHLNTYAEEFNDFLLKYGRYSLIDRN